MLLNYCTWQGYVNKKAYIIAEGPMPTTIRNMWKVIFDYDCSAIVMLSEIIEDRKVGYIYFFLR